MASSSSPSSTFVSAAADPLLTTLCAVCRASPPRYKCPRCAVRYCSVGCNRRHRARAGCSGIRDVTAFVPRSRLRTPAGIDHDYNFLRGIELARTRAERQIVDERRLLRANDLRPRVVGESDAPPPDARRPYANGRKNQRQSPLPLLQKQWHGDELRFVPLQRPLPKGASDVGPSNKKVRALCRRDGIQWLGVPQGLARQRENNTTVATLPGTGNKETRRLCLHWQVEWLVYEDGLGKPPTRILRRLLDHVPLFRAYVSTMAWVLQKQGVKLVDEADEEDEAAHDESREAIVDGEMDTRADDGANVETMRAVQSQPGRSHKPKQAKQKQNGRPLITAVNEDEGNRDRQRHGFFSAFSFQDPMTATWKTVAAEPSVDAKEEEDLDVDHLAAKQDMRYFLLKPRLPTDGALNSAGPESKSSVESAETASKRGPPAKELIPLGAEDTLATALRGRAVLEFPTIYVLPAVARIHAADGDHLELPSGHVLGSTARRIVVDDKADDDDDDERNGAKEQKRMPAKRSRPMDQPAGQQHREARASLVQQLEGGSSAKKRKTVQFAGIQDLDEAEDEGEEERDNQKDEAAALESETSSEGTTSSSEEEGSDEEEEEEEEVGEVAGVDEGEIEAALPPLKGLNGNATTTGKPGLVVYDSWSEGSEGEEV